ncbi:MAG TPA: GlsB/YeaQ/YmgE family stress response membrane protein [Usitatibacter sp.]|nr:GlsB/YeaQ/YmgE family stress response membrane protein [Usitatibacter sp.]
MSIIWAIVIGFIVGLIAKALMPGRDPGGFIVTVLLGIVGAVVATFLGQAMGLYAAGQSAGWIASVIGAIVVLAIYRMVVGRRRVV